MLLETKYLHLRQLLRRARLCFTDPQINMHTPEAQAKGDISILLARGHFYFALTIR
jgi:hypothetical protein